MYVHPPVKPYEGDELHFVMMGVKPIVVIWHKLNPEMYNKAQELHHVVSVYQQDLGVISVTLNENSHLHKEIMLG